MYIEKGKHIGVRLLYDGFVKKQYSLDLLEGVFFQEKNLLNYLPYGWNVFIGYDSYVSLLNRKEIWISGVSSIEGVSNLLHEIGHAWEYECGIIKGDFYDEVYAWEYALSVLSGDFELTENEKWRVVNNAVDYLSTYAPIPLGVKERLYDSISLEFNKEEYG